MNNLIMLTTCGMKDFLIEALNSLKDDKHDILIIDDGSKVNYLNLISNYDKNIQFIQKKSGKGLTHTWNLGYKYFLDNNYDNCLLSNDDVLFPNKVPEDMWLGLKDYILIGPLSDPIGSGRFCGNFQNIDTYIRGISDYKDVILINNKLQKKHPNKKFLEIGKDIRLPREEPPYINGFCFSFNKKIKEYEYENGILFDPKKINIGNEKELQRDRLNKGKAISIKSYIYHHKGQSLTNDRNNVINVNKF